MRAVVTGAAGFIGSHLSEQLVSEGWDVTGVDCFTEYYDASLKERNISELTRSSSFDLVTDDLVDADLDRLLDGADVVFHLAGQPGVRGSWGSDFRVHVERNIMTTQRLLEACRTHRIRKFVLASSSSVYGNAASYPLAESHLPTPISPYGVSKLSAERLALAYDATYQVPVLALRYFTVFGPRQRPDMAFNRFIGWISSGREIVLYGDGSQQRDFTYVADAVRATINAGTSEATGKAVNVGGGNMVVLNDVLEELGCIIGKPLIVRRAERQPGDVDITGADISLAREILDYRPATSLVDGLRAQVDFQLQTAAVEAKR